MIKTIWMFEVIVACGILSMLKHSEISFTDFFQWNDRKDLPGSNDIFS